MKLTKSKLRFLFLVPLFILCMSCSDSVDPESDLELSIYPNPMSEFGTIVIYIPTEATVTILITDNSGREVIRIIDDKALESGPHHFVMELLNQPSGVYSCILKINGDVYIREFTVIR